MMKMIDLVVQIQVDNDLIYIIDSNGNDTGYLFNIKTNVFIAVTVTGTNKHMPVVYDDRVFRAVDNNIFQLNLNTNIWKT